MHEVEGLSCNQLQFFNSFREKLLTVRYTHRQKKAVSVIKFLVEDENIKKAKTALKDLKNKDAIYQESMSEPILKAQASQVKNKSSVILRLLTYLLPYKKRLFFGVTSAFMLTIVGLLPPYVTGYFIDHSF